MNQIENAIPPLTQLTEDEQMLRDAAADCKSSIGPLVNEMDEQAKLNPGLVKEFLKWV